MLKRRPPIVIGTVVCLAAALFVLLGANAHADGRLAALDTSIALEMKTASVYWPSLRHAMIALSYSGGIPAMTLLATLGVLWEGWRGRAGWRLAVAWALIVSSGALINQVLKASYGRDRPPLEWRDPVVTERNESFPSGHAMGITIGAGLLGYTLLLRVQRPRHKILIVLLLTCWVLGVGSSRVFLRAHWFSDVLAGFAIGLAWLSLGLGVFEIGVRSEEWGGSELQR